MLKTIQKKRSLNKGFSLMEVLVFTTILSLFFVAAATIVTYMLQTARVNQNRILATRYAEELLEWMRAERDIDWNAFTLRSDATGSITHCFSSSPPAWSGESPCNFTLDNTFRRTARLTGSVAGGYTYQVNVEILVEWNDGGKLYAVPVNSTFAVLEQ